MSLEISNHQRSKKIIITDQARVLRRLRESSGLSIRQVAQKLGRHHTTIAHIECGRMDVPKGERLLNLLSVYGVTYESFDDRVRNFSERKTPTQELSDLIERLGSDRIGIAIEILKQVAAGSRVVAV